MRLAGLSRTPSAFAALILSVGLVAGACSSDDGSAVESGAASSTTASGGTAGPQNQNPRTEVAGARQRDAGTIEITAASLAFRPAEIRATAGQELVVRLASTDLHNFTIDELDLRPTARRQKAGSLSRDPVGTRSIASFPGHRGGGMTGTLVVME